MAFTPSLSAAMKKNLTAAKDKLGELCYPMQCDMSKLSSIPGLITRIINDFGKIDILVNNAGINMKKDFADVTDEEFNEIHYH